MSRPAQSALAVVQQKTCCATPVESISEGRTGLLRVNLLKSGYREYLLQYRSKVRYFLLIYLWPCKSVCEDVNVRGVGVLAHAVETCEGVDL